MLELACPLNSSPSLSVQAGAIPSNTDPAAAYTAQQLGVRQPPSQPGNRGAPCLGSSLRPTAEGEGLFGNALVGSVTRALKMHLCLLHLRLSASVLPRRGHLKLAPRRLPNSRLSVHRREPERSGLSTLQHLAAAVVVIGAGRRAVGGDLVPSCDDGAPTRLPSNGRTKDHERQPGLPCRLARAGDRSGCL